MFFFPFLSDVITDCEGALEIWRISSIELNKVRNIMSMNNEPKWMDQQSPTQFKQW